MANGDDATNLQPPPDQPTATQPLPSPGDLHWGDWERTPQAQPPQKPFEPYRAILPSRPPGQWAQPDFILDGARKLPGLAPGPFMPQARDVPHVLQSLFGGLGRTGSPQVRSLILAAAASHSGWLNSYLKGWEMRQKMLHQQFSDNLAQAQEAQRKESEEYAVAFAKYPDGSQQQRDAVRAVALRQHPPDKDMLEALNGNDPAAPHRLQQVRDGYWLSGEKYRSQTEKERAAQAEREKIGQPMPEDPETTAAPVTPPATGASKYSGLPGDDDLVKPDAPATSMPDTPDAATGPRSEVAPSRPTPIAAAPSPTAVAQVPPSPTPATALAQPQQPAAAASAAPRGGAVPDLTNTYAQASPEEMRAAGAPGAPRVPPLTTAHELPPPRMTAPGFSATRLDQLARRYLETERDIFTKANSGELDVERNEAVARRSVQMETAINRIIDDPNLTPDQRYDLINKIDPGLAGYARAVANYQEAMPGRGATGNRYARLIAQLVPRLRPDFQQQGYQRLQKVIGDFSPAGYAGKALLAADTMARDAANVIRAARDLPSDFIPENIWNKLAARTWTGDPRYTTLFNAWRAYVMAQVRVGRGGTGAEGDIERSIKEVPVVASKAQIFSAVKIDTDDALGQADALERHWNVVGMRGDPGLLTSENRAILHALERMNPVTGDIPGDVPERLRGSFFEGTPYGGGVSGADPRRRAPLFGTDSEIRVKP